MVEEKKNESKILAIFGFIIIIAIMGGVIRTETHILHQNKVDKIQDSLWNDLYYSIVDTFEKDAFLVTASTYNAKQNQCDKTPLITASSLKITNRSKFIALSRDLQEEFKYGEIITLQNAGQYNGDYVVADCMNVRFIRTIDILIKSNKHTKLFNVILKHKYKDVN